MRTPLLSVRDVHVRWGTVTALRGVDLDVDAGEFVGLVGPNGAGKTTLLRVMAKLLEPSRGAVRLDGQNLAGLSRRAVARSVAVVPQVAPADFAFAVRDVVSMGRYPHLDRFQPEGPEDRAAVAEAMTFTDVANLADRSMTELSGGERQCVALARALAQRPRLLLLDEPTASLDLRHQVHVLDRVRRLVRDAGLAAVAALHDLSLASRYCARLVLMRSGAIVADGQPETVVTVRRLRQVFGVTADITRHPDVGGLTITVLEAAKEGGAAT